MADWGSKGVDDFTSTQHSQPYQEILPTNTKLPSPYVVCIIGASKGIGAGLAHAFAAAGASKLILTARDSNTLKDTRTTCEQLNAGCDIGLLECDISNDASVERLSGMIGAQTLDAILVNGGYSGPVTTDVAEGDSDTFEQVTKTNYVGTYHAAHYLLPLLRTEGAVGNSPKGFFVVGSNAGLIVRGPIANTQYCVSKFAQMKLIEHIHEQYKDLGVLAISVHPGAVLSDMARETAPPGFLQYCTDSPNLCGAFMTWLLRPRGEDKDLMWLGGRHLVAKWDVGELLAKKEEIIRRDLLKAKLSL